MTETQHTEHGSRIITALEEAWAAIRARHPEVPRVVMITGTGREKRYMKWGHFGADLWVQAEGGRAPELFASGELISLGGRRVMQTLLHEAAHALAHVRGVKDTSSAGRYHNKRFAGLAGELGLSAPSRPAPVLGWSECTIPDPTAEVYVSAIGALDAARLPYLPGAAPFAEAGTETGETPATAPKASRAGKRFAVECQCPEPRRIQITPKAWEAGPLMCGVCTSVFEPIG